MAGAIHALKSLHSGTALLNTAGMSTGHCHTVTNE
jgi:hypothetical protein